MLPILTPTNWEIFRYFFEDEVYFHLYYYINKKSIIYFVEMLNFVKRDAQMNF